ncbi:MAG: efflux RND transporter periplasmic adaptor subunit [Chloroflexi bacterium]|nr:efflux RND transporter periplasmic adaptor subunit [Chloroflexota bacterium]MBM3182851.1 efflux RND transporter periplasmic adaptor subunit [Chloroflexota bacterium]MBM4452289.1 efflux RND transporter periplasmic adaptor subunit [Chloroflexota bacterium]MBM4453753.1 efflux RND transporter periplasmic adaptor subunit [Chloroflexota bacterium]
MTKRITLIVAITVSLISLLLSGCGKDAAPAGKTFEVKRGDLNITISTDGYLTMPNQFDLKFGTTGQVAEILVEEGEQVKQGALLAMLDNTSQKNAIKTALFDIQTAKNNITLGCGPDRLPYTYADRSVPRLMKEAQRDIDAAIGYFEQGNYKDAGYWLVMTYFDVEVCEDLIRYKPDAAVLAGVQSNSTYYPDINAGSSAPPPDYIDMVIDYLQSYRARLLDISQLLKAGSYAEIKPKLEQVHLDMRTVSQLAVSTVYKKGRSMFEYPDTATSADFLQAAIRQLQELEKYIAQDNANPVEAAKKLYTAKLSLLVGRDVLENQTRIFESGGSINWKTLEQYNIDLQSAEVGLYKNKQEIMKTVIIAPSDGDVVSVDLKKSYVLSAQDYSARTAIKLVDTSTIKFQGTVDEIDIAKVKPGQKTRITIDAVPDKIFTGTVKFISPFGTQVGRVIKFAVTIELDPTDVELRGGLSATAEISIYNAKDVLLVPVSVIATTPAGHIVAVVNEATGQIERRQITVGMQTFEFAEVLSGLKEGEKVQVISQEAIRSLSTAPQRPGAPVPMRLIR